MDLTGKPWTYRELKLLMEMVKEKAAARIIAEKLGRTEKEVRAKIKDLTIPED